MSNATASEAVTLEMQAGIHRLHARIAAHPFARGLSHEEVAVLADCAMETHFAPGELIFREGDFSNRFYLLLDGAVTLESRTPAGAVPVEIIHGGDVLGWSWLFPPYCWHFDARAVKPTRAIFFYGTWLREHCEQDRSLGYRLVMRMAAVMIRRLQATRKKLSAVLAQRIQVNDRLPTKERNEP